MQELTDKTDTGHLKIPNFRLSTKTYLRKAVSEQLHLVFASEVKKTCLAKLLTNSCVSVASQNKRPNR